MVLLFFKKVYKFMDPIRLKQMSAVDRPMGPQKEQFFFPMALRPNAGHGLLILDVSRSHTTTQHSR